MSSRDRTAVQLRRLTVDDWPLWREVRLRALADAPAAFGSTLDEWRGGRDVEPRWRARLRDVPFNLVAMVEGAPVGQVSGSGPDDEGRCELTSLWVDPSARGAGIGEALVEAVAAWARSIGGSAVALSARQANVHAVALYTRSSFVPLDEPGADGCDLRMLREL